METQTKNIQTSERDLSVAELQSNEQPTFLQRESEKFMNWISDFENAIKKINAGLL